MRSLTARSDSDSSRTSSSGRLSRKNVIRCAALGPTPGSRCSAPVKRAAGSGWYVYGLLHPQAGDLESTGDLAHLLLDELARLAQRFVGGGEDEILEHLHVVLAHHLGVDLDRNDL